jgi:hypothetical protein
VPPEPVPPEPESLLLLHAAATSARAITATTSFTVVRLIIASCPYGPVDTTVGSSIRFGPRRSQPGDGSNGVAG